MPLPNYILSMRWEIEYTDKTGNKRWYEINVPIADRLYDEHVEQLRKEGLIDD